MGGNDDVGRGAEGGVGVSEGQYFEPEDVTDVTWSEELSRLRSAARTTSEATKALATAVVSSLPPPGSR
jgi:hypothetical protein